MDSQSTHESGDAVASALPNDAPLSAQPMAAFGSLKRPTALGKSAWNEESTPKGKRTNRFLRAALYVSLGFCSFIFFLYLTFPYGVLKEVLVSKITESIQKAGYPVRVGIGSLRPNWITGIQAENVIVSNSTDSTALLKLGIVTARVNLLPLLIGQIGISAYVSQSGGYLDADLKIPMFGAIKGAGPKFVQVNFKSFSLDPIFNHVLAIARGSRDPAMVLVLPLLAKTVAGGSLSGRIQLDNPEPMTFVKAVGKIDLSIANGFLHIDDSTLLIPKQSFTTAKVDLNFGNNSITIGNSTKFSAEDIGIGLGGKIGLPESAAAQANADLDLELTMRGNIEKSLGFIVPNMLRCKPLTNGTLKAKLSGPVANMACQ